MNLKTVSVSYQRKLNLGDFNSAMVECSLWADLDPADNEDQVMAALWDMAKTNVKTQLAPLTTKIKAQAEQVFLGLPLEVREQLQLAENPFPQADNDDLLDGEI